MVKILIGVVLLIALATGFAFFKYFNKSSPSQIKMPYTNPASSVSEDDSTPSSNLTSPLSPKESEGEPESLSPAQSGTVATRVDILEGKLSVLQKRIESIESKTTTSQTTSTSSKAPSYEFALGSSGGVTTQDWSSMSSLSATFDPANYPGYKSFQLEVELQQFQGNGTAYARLYNNTDKLAVFGSDVSTPSFTYTWVSSQTFSLPSSKKTYILQLKTTTGYTASANNFRIKVNY